ncbi:MAG: MSHA biogenesis protein MshK [Phenylobacterium sp.]|jgi:MSHA biogenesis protein MshK
MNVLLQYKTGLACIVSALTLFFVMVFGVSAADLVKDPTRPLLTLGLEGGQSARKPEEEQEKALILQSVIVKGGLSKAIINDQVMKVGQIIEGYELTTISAYGAKLRRDGKGLSLSLFNLNNLNIRKK